MPLDHAAHHAAISARDARFDGAFFTAVKTTGIYCRPICPARTPRAENCTFFETAAAAEAAGYRPCLRCRPELSPLAHARADNVAGQFIRLVERDGLFGENLESAASQLGVSSRHLRRSVEQECGVSPAELVRTTRLLFARRLLSTTSLPVSRVAFGSGFNSLARFNHSFRTQYGEAPGAFRRQSAKPSHANGIRLALAYREPFAWDAMLAFLGKRALPGIECVRAGRYWRTVRAGDRCGWFSAGLGRNRSLDIEVSDELATSLLALAGRIRAMFDLDSNPEPIASVLCADPQLRPLVERVPGMRVPGAFDGFELAVRAVLGQQVSVAGANTLAGRLIEKFATSAQGLPDGLTRHPLEAEALAAAEPCDIASIGLPATRAATIHSLATAVATGKLDFKRPTTAPGVLMSIPGIGPWTRDYIAMRALRWPDAFASGDLGLRKALKPPEPCSAKELEIRSEAWKPWRAYAAMYLWTAATEKK